MRRALACSTLVGLLLISIVSPIHALRNLAQVRPRFLVGAVSSRLSDPIPAATPGLRQVAVPAGVEPLPLRSRSALAPPSVVGSPVDRDAAPREFAMAPAASYMLTWWTVDGGGYTFSRGGGYTLGGTIGQPDANVLRGGGLTLAGGFWGGGEVVTVDHRIYLPLVLRRS